MSSPTENNPSSRIASLEIKTQELSPPKAAKLHDSAWANVGQTGKDIVSTGGALFFQGIANMVSAPITVVSAILGVTIGGLRSLPVIGNDKGIMGNMHSSFDKTFEVVSGSRGSGSPLFLLTLISEGFGSLAHVIKGGSILSGEIPRKSNLLGANLSDFFLQAAINERLGKERHTEVMLTATNNRTTEVMLTDILKTSKLGQKIYLCFENSEGYDEALTVTITAGMLNKKENLLDLAEFSPLRDGRLYELEGPFESSNE